MNNTPISYEITYSLKLDYTSPTTFGVRMWAVYPYEGETYEQIDDMKLNTTTEIFSIFIPPDVDMLNGWNVITNTVDDIVNDFCFIRDVHPSKIRYVSEIKTRLFRELIQSRKQMEE